MALVAEVVDLVGLHQLKYADQIGAVDEVAVMKRQAGMALVRILVEVIDPLGVEAAGLSLDTMNLMASFNEKFRKVGTVLAGDACN
jgi:hypothetical protein